MFVLPVNEDGYVGRRAYVLLALGVANALVLAATYLHPSQADAIFRQYGFVPAHPQFSTLLVSMFLHAGFWHFAGNMFFLWMFGYRVENTFGRLLFTAMYLVCGCGATALHYVFNQNSDIPLVGASGAISGIVGCYFVLFPKSKFDIVIFVLRWPVKTIHTYTHAAVGAWIGEQAILGVLTQAVQFSSVAFWGHVGGFVTGASLTALLLVLAPQLRTRGDGTPVVRLVRGGVRDSMRRPLADVQFDLKSGSHVPTSVLSDRKGRFSLPPVAEGTYTFHITKAGFQPIEGTLIVARRHKRLSSALQFTMSTVGEQAAVAKAGNSSA